MDDQEQEVEKVWLLFMPEEVKRLEREVCLVV